MTRFLMVASVIAFAITEARGGQHVQPSFGKKKADKDYVVPKQVIQKLLLLLFCCTFRIYQEILNNGCKDLRVRG